MSLHSYERSGPREPVNVASQPVPTVYQSPPFKASLMNAPCRRSLQFITKPLFLTLALVLARDRAIVRADTILQSSTYSLSGTTPQPVAWNQFDPSVGTLTGISLTVNGTTTGSFTMSNTSTDPIFLSNPQAALRAIFASGTDSPGTKNGSLTTLPTTPSMSTPYSLSGTSSQQFSISALTALSPISSDLTVNSSYFTGLGSVLMNLLHRLAVTSTDTGSTEQSIASLGTDGVATLQYTFTAVPEPASLAVLGGCVLGAFLTVRRRFKRA